MYGRILTYFTADNVDGHHNNLSFTASGSKRSYSVVPATFPDMAGYPVACYIDQVYSGTAYMRYSEEIDLTQYRQLDIRITGVNTGGSNTFGRVYIIIEQNGAEVKSVELAQSGKYLLRQIDIGGISGNSTIGFKLVHATSGYGCQVGFNSVTLLPFYCPTS